MGQLSRARLKLAALLCVAVALILWPIWFRSTSDGVEEPGKRKPMPQFSYPTLAGEQWSLQENKGRIVLVNFWATWCGPCREETPALVRVYKRYRDKGFEIAGVSMDEDPAKVAPGFAKLYKVDYPILVPPITSALAQAIENLPTSFLVDRSGRIARTWVGAVREQDITGAVEKLLVEESAPEHSAKP